MIFKRNEYLFYTNELRLFPKINKTNIKEGENAPQLESNQFNFSDIKVSLVSTPKELYEKELLTIKKTPNKLHTGYFWTWPFIRRTFNLIALLFYWLSKYPQSADISNILKHNFLKKRIFPPKFRQFEFNMNNEILNMSVSGFTNYFRSLI